MIRKAKKGFTIVELVIVIAVIGVLAAVLIPTFISLNKKAEEKADNALVRNINNALRIEEAQEGKNSNLHEAVLDLDEYGYKLANLVSKSGQRLLWDQDKDEFVLDAGEAKYNDYHFWEIRSSMPGSGNKRSIYAGNGWTVKNVGEGEGIDYGFDVGENTVDSINYKNTGATQNAIIRTSSAGTNLTVDAANDTVYHYGALGSLNIIKANTASYHENGKVAYAEVAYGRIVLEEGSKVEEIHVNKKTDSSFDTVIIVNNGGEEELPERITRDAVSVSSETLVVTVESSGASENVYVYADGETGKTNKVTEGSNKQNENVNSALGQLVLDNGANPGEKAQTAEQKEAAKEELVEEAITEEIIDKGEAEGKTYIARIGMDAYESLQAAWNVGKGKTIVLLSDLTQNGFYAYGTYTLDLNGHTLALRGHSAISGAFGTDGGANYDHTNLTIKNGTLNLTGANYSTYGIYNYGTLTLKDLVINSACQTVIYSNGQQWGGAGTTTLDNVTINATHSSGTAVAAYSFKSSWAGTVKPNVVIKNSTILAAYNAVMMYGVDATVENCTISAENNNALWISNSAMGSGVYGTVTVSGNTTINAGSDYKRLNAASGHTIKIVEGSYNFDPTSRVDSELYNIAENAGVWVVTAK